MTRGRRLLLPFAAAFAVGLVVGLITGWPSSGDSSGPVNGPAARPVERDTIEEIQASEGIRGSVSARDVAVEYATASQEWLYLTDEQIDAAVREIAAPDQADRLSRETVSELSVARDGLQYSAGRIWWFVRPLATKVMSETDDRAEVSVWVVTVLSAADVAVPQADWVTLDLVLARAGDRWLLESINDTVGPTPMSGVRDEPWQPEPFDDALDGFERIGSDTP